MFDPGRGVSYVQQIRAPFAVLLPVPLCIRLLSVVVGRCPGQWVKMRKKLKVPQAVGDCTESESRNPHISYPSCLTSIHVSQASCLLLNILYLVCMFNSMCFQLIISSIDCTCCWICLLPEMLAAEHTCSQTSIKRGRFGYKHTCYQSYLQPDLLATGSVSTLTHFDLKMILKPFSISGRLFPTQFILGARHAGGKVFYSL